MRKILLLFFVSVSYLSSGQQTAWDYPIKPGSEKWRSLKSHKEMVQACQIPEDVIKLISTKDLASICLDYPLFFTLTAFNNMQQGFDQVITEFNGFKEFYQRPDFGTTLLEVYANIKNEDLTLFSTNLDRGRFKFKIFYLELMLAQENVFKNLKETDLIQLLKVSYQMGKQKQNYSYSVFQIQTSYLVIARLLSYLNDDNFNKNYQLDPKRYNMFLKSIILPDKELIGEIDTMASEYLRIRGI